MKIIYKYKLPIEGNQTIDMPEGAVILHVGEQDRELCLWALVDIKAKLVPTNFQIYGTGHPVQQNADFLYYLGTIQMSYGLVWHVFNAPN
jgi:hypothetical protein